MQLDQMRYNMVHRQVKPEHSLGNLGNTSNHSTKNQIIDIMLHTPRELFVPSGYEKLAFAEYAIPLKHKQFMLQPSLAAKLIQALPITKSDIILEIGTGSGYITALLAQMANKIDSIEIFIDLITQAERNLHKLNLSNINLIHADAAKYLLDSHLYDFIILTGSLLNPPERFLNLLSIGGTMLVPLGSSPIMHITTITRTAKDAWQYHSLFETYIPPLINFNKEAHFAF